MKEKPSFRIALVKSTAADSTAEAKTFFFALFMSLLVIGLLLVPH